MYGCEPRQRPYFVTWVFTARCNLNCKHCYATPFKSIGELSRRRKLQLIEELAEFGVSYIGLTGGEPLIHPDLKIILNTINEYGLGVTIVTNAIYIPRNMLTLLKRSRAFVYVSIDGPREIHDSMRGPGTYDRVIENVKRIKSEGIPFAIVMAVSKLNYRYSDYIIELASKLDADHATLIPVLPAGNALNTKIFIGRSEFLEALRSAEEKVEEVGYWLTLWCTPFTPLVVKSKRIEHYFCRTYRYVDIDPGGRLLACDVLHDVAITDVSRKRFADAWAEYMNNNIIRDLVYPKSLPEECMECPIREYCKGGCFARSYRIFGEFNKGDPLCPRVKIR